MICAVSPAYPHCKGSASAGDAYHDGDDVGGGLDDHDDHGDHGLDDNDHDNEPFP